MSSKVVADVFEALIGAAYVDGGLGKALDCIRTLLPNQEWYSHQNSIDRLLQDHELGPAKQTNFMLLERLIGHGFSHPGLLNEAITHASYPHSGPGLSYERLEYLGDAVLDLLVVSKLFAHPRHLKHWEMHRMREALVCGSFLGYCCMRYGIDEDRFDVVEDRSSNERRLQLQRSSRQVHLHDFLRANVLVQTEKHRSLKPFEEFHEAVDRALEQGTEFPWPELFAMASQKFMSDMIEAVIGALFIDSKGDLSVCEAFIERLGT